ncbi:MAG: helix-turn-helix domain-containing protein [Saprospiraceae bacterium]
MGTNPSKWTYFGKLSRALTANADFCRMNHPGIFISLLYLVLLAGSIALVDYLKNNPGQTGGYVCPPCGCSRHDYVLPEPGICEGCEMPLISVNRSKNQAFAFIFDSSETNFYHHKLFYPVNFLAIFISVFALFRFRRAVPVVLFLAFFGCFVLYSFKNQLHGTEYSMHAAKKWTFFPISFLLAAGPALFLYVEKILKNENRFSRREWLHFLPTALVFLLDALLFLGPENWRKLALYNNYDHFPGLAEQIAFLVSGIFYGILAGKIARESQPADPRFEKWQRSLRFFFAAVVVMLAAMILGNFFYFDLMSTWLDYHPVWLCIAVFTLWCTYFLVFKNEVISQSQKITVREQRLSDEKIMDWKALVEAVMQDQKPFFDPELSLQKLAQTVGLKEKDLSEVLNIGCGKSFHDFVNYYRVEEVKRLLLNPEKQHLTNFALAQEAGFNSKSAFFGLFRKFAGTTPGKFKKENGL